MYSLLFLILGVCLTIFGSVGNFCAGRSGMSVAKSVWLDVAVGAGSAFLIYGGHLLP